MGRDWKKRIKRKRRQAYIGRLKARAKAKSTAPRAVSSQTQPASL